MNEDHNCKCSHLKSEHKKYFLGRSRECDNCPCSLYLKSSRPEKSDKFMMYFCGTMSIVLVLTVFAIAYDLSLTPDETVNQTYINSDGEEVTVGNLLLAIFGFIILMVALLEIMLLEIFFEIKRMSHRKDYN